MRDLGYRFFPIIILGFLRVANAVAIGLAIPLYFDQAGYNPALIGILGSALDLTYFFSPLIFKNIPSRFGKKKPLIFSVGGTVLIQICFQFSLEPSLFFILRLIEGLLLGLFWPTLNSSVSAVSSLEDIKNNDILKDKLMKNYSIGWSTGGIFSYIVSAFVLFIISDLQLIFDMILIFMIICFITTFFFEEPKSNEGKKEKHSIVERAKIESRENIVFPIYIPLILIMISGFLHGSNQLLYPLKSQLLGFALYTSYFFSFIRITLQAIFISRGVTISITNLKKATIISIGFLTISYILMGLNQILIVFGILFGIFGICRSFLYNLSFKLIIFRNIKENTSKYSSYYESSLGLSFFLAPVISGFIAATDINLAFYCLAAISLFSLIFFVSVRNKIKSK